MSHVISICANRNILNDTEVLHNQIISTNPRTYIDNIHKRLSQRRIKMNDYDTCLNNVEVLGTKEARY